jgi:hypothetical protein
LALILLRLFGVAPQVYYFGLFPIVHFKGQDSYTGWDKFAFTLFSYIFHPIIAFYSGSGEDKEGYKAAVESLLVKGELTEEFAGQKFAKGAVCEAFFEKARAVGAIKDSTWEDAINALTETGRKIFNSDYSGAVKSSKNLSSSYYKDTRKPNIRAVGVEPTASNADYINKEEAYMEELREKEKVEEEQKSLEIQKAEKERRETPDSAPPVSPDDNQISHAYRSGDFMARFH